jgi:hypothetical protein
MRFIALILAFFALSIFAACSEDGGMYLHVNEVTMRLEGENATFDLNYTLDTFARIYIMALGCRYLEPELISFLGGYSEVELVSADIDGASLRVKGAGKYNSGYYLFDSTPFGSIGAVRREAIPSFSVVYPGGRIRTFYNVTATQNVFSEASDPLPSSTRKK